MRTIDTTSTRLQSSRRAEVKNLRYQKQSQYICILRPREVSQKCADTYAERSPQQSFSSYATLLSISACDLCVVELIAQFLLPEMASSS